VFTERYAMRLYTAVFIGLKRKCIANTNLFVKQVDSIAARGSCIFLGVLLRDCSVSSHAVKIWVQKYIMLYSILWLAWYF
jgi:hypothetical protein